MRATTAASRIRATSFIRRSTAGKPYIEAKTARHQFCPVPVEPAPGALLAALARHSRFLPVHSRRHRNNRTAPCGGRRQQAVVEDQVDPRPCYERRQALEQFHWGKHRVRRAIRPPAAQLEHDLPIGTDAKTLVAH